MSHTEELSNPERYKFLIQIKKNRRLRRNAKYLNEEYEFVEDIKKAKSFPDIQSAEEELQKVLRISTERNRPRIIIKYLEIEA